MLEFFHHTHAQCSLQNISIKQHLAANTATKAVFSSRQQQLSVNGIWLINFTCTIRMQYSSDQKYEKSLIIFSKVVTLAQTQEGMNKIVCHVIMYFPVDYKNCYLNSSAVLCCCERMTG